MASLLAEDLNLGLTRMVEACDVGSRGQLAWTSDWHIREETYAIALQRLVNQQQREPLAALFGPPTLDTLELLDLSLHVLAGTPVEERWKQEADGRAHQCVANALMRRAEAGKASRITSDNTPKALTPIPAPTRIPTMAINAEALARTFGLSRR